MRIEEEGLRLDLVRKFELQQTKEKVSALEGRIATCTTNMEKAKAAVNQAKTEGFPFDGPNAGKLLQDELGRKYIGGDDKTRVNLKTKKIVRGDYEYSVAFYFRSHGFTVLGDGDKEVVNLAFVAEKEKALDDLTCEKQRLVKEWEVEKAKMPSLF